jgi:ATP synthase protein I
MVKLIKINGFDWRVLGKLNSLISKSVRRVLQWQLIASLGIALVAGLLFGVEGAVSAMLGGFVMMSAGCLFACMAGSRKIRPAGETLRTLIRAEASKIGLIVMQLWLVLTAYESVVPLVFIGTFIVAVMIHPIALLVRD